MQFVTLEDETGLIEAVIFPDAYRAIGRSLNLGQVIPACGVADQQDGVVILRWTTDDEGERSKGRIGRGVPEAPGHWR